MRSIVAIEGINGVGKSTVCRALKSDYRTIRFPGEPSNQLAVDIRSLFQHKMHGETQMLLMLADMNEVMVEERKLGDGVTIADRSLLSTLAYDGFRAREFLKLMPAVYFDAAIILHASKDAIKERLENRQHQTIRQYDGRPVEWYMELQERYVASAQVALNDGFLKKVVYIDTSGQTEEETARAVKEQLWTWNY